MPDQEVAGISYLEHNGCVSFAVSKQALAKPEMLHGDDQEVHVLLSPFGEIPN